MLLATPSAGAATRSRGWRRRLGAGLLLLGATLTVVVATQALWLGAVIGHRLSATSGRAVAIGRATFGMTMALEPVVRLREVAIANAPWADAAWPLARAGEATFVLSWRSLWADRRIVSLLVLRDATVDLERQADGLRNWRLRDPDDRGPGRWRFLRVRAERSTLRFVNGAIDLAFEVSAAADRNTDRRQRADLPLRLDFRGRWREVPFEASVATGSELTFYDTGASFALRGRLEAGGAVLDAEGRAGDVLRLPRLDLRLQVAGRSLAPFAAFVGARGQEPRGYRIAGRLLAADGRYTLKDAEARFGHTDLRGEVGSGHDASGREQLRFDVRSERADWADVEWWLGSPGAAARHPSSRPAPLAPALAASPAARPFARLRESDLDLRYRAARLELPAGPEVTAFSIEAKLEGGQLAVPSLALGLAGGQVDGRGTLDARQDDAAARVDLRWQGIRIEALLPPQKEAHRLTGIVRGHADLAAHGGALKEMLASANGDLEATLGNGTIASRLDAELGLELGKIVRSMLGGDGPLPLACAHVAASLAGGRARLGRLVVDSARTRITGSGGVDLRDETMDIVLTPRAKTSGWFDLDRSIRLHGPIVKPERELVPRQAAASASGAAGC